jgi:excinuclease ABC subunit A
VERLVRQLDGLVESGNTVILVEHEMRVVSASDWMIEVGPGAGEAGGRIVVAGAPGDAALSGASRTAPYLRRFMGL